MLLPRCWLQRLGSELLLKEHQKAGVTAWRTGSRAADLTEVLPGLPQPRGADVELYIKKLNPI